MVACFAKYLTRVSVREQKCSFGLRTYVRHREAIVSKAVCMIWSIRNGWERLACLAGICITIPGIHYYFALTNDRRPGKTRHLYWDIWQGHNLCPLKRRSAHTGSFVYICQAELRVEISLPQQLTSASCFLSARPPFEPVLSERVFFPAKDRPASLDCLCDAVAERRRVQVHFRPNCSRPHAAKSGQTGMSEPRWADRPSQHLSGNEGNDEQESGKLLKEFKLPVHHYTDTMRNHLGCMNQRVYTSCLSSSFFSGCECELVFKIILLVFKALNGPHPTYLSAKVLWTPRVFF